MPNTIERLERVMAECRALLASLACMGLGDREDAPRDLLVALVNNFPFRKFFTAKMAGWMARDEIEAPQESKRYPLLFQLYGACIIKMERHAADRGQKFMNMETTDHLGRMKKAIDKFFDAVNEGKPSAGFLIDAVNYGWMALLKTGELDPPEKLQAANGQK